MRVRALALALAEQETDEEVRERLERLRGERAGLFFTWLEGWSTELLPAANWLAYGNHAPGKVRTSVPTWAQLTFLRALVRAEAPGLVIMCRRLIEWSPLARAAMRIQRGEFD